MAFPRKSLPLATLLLTGCGYIGDPLPPALHIPNRVTDLRVLQRADKAVVEFTIPALTTEGLPLRLGKTDLRAGPYAQAPFDAGAWAAQANPLDTAGLKPGPVHLERPVPDWIGHEVFFRVRIFSHNGRDSGWSDFARLQVIPPLEKASGLRADAVAEGVRLQWTGPQGPSGLTFRILRRTGKAAISEVALVNGYEWLDRDTRYGSAYEYSVQAVVKAGESTAESELSDPVTITPVDRFPPAVPSGVTAMAGTSSVELTWDRNTEADLGGYFLYRTAGGGAFERIGGLLNTPSYSDRDVKPGAQYRYAVSAVDQLGNESGRSRPAEIALP